MSIHGAQTEKSRLCSLPNFLNIADANAWRPEGYSDTTTFYELHAPWGTTKDTDIYELLILYVPNLFHHISTIRLSFVRYAPGSGLGQSIARGGVNVVTPR